MDWQSKAKTLPHSRHSHSTRITVGKLPDVLTGLLAKDRRRRILEAAQSRGGLADRTKRTGTPGWGTLRYAGPRVTPTVDAIVEVITARRTPGVRVRITDGRRVWCRRRLVDRADDDSSSFGALTAGTEVGQEVFDVLLDAVRQRVHDSSTFSHRIPDSSRPAAMECFMSDPQCLPPETIEVVWERNGTRWIHLRIVLQLVQSWLTNNYRNRIW